MLRNRLARDFIDEFFDSLSILEKYSDSALMHQNVPQEADLWIVFGGAS